MFRSLLLVVLAVGPLAGCGPGAPREEKPAPRVGEIRIWGNFVTPDSHIRDNLQIYPGQVLSWGLVYRGQMMLALAGLDAEILVREPEDGGVFHDLEVCLRETPLQYLVFAGRESRDPP
jgi:hypothetical protein